MRLLTRRRLEEVERAAWQAGYDEAQDEGFGEAYNDGFRDGTRYRAERYTNLAGQRTAS